MKEQLTILKALSDRNRLRIVSALDSHEELCACQITELLGVSGATASRHLSQLTDAQLLQSRKEGRWVYYRLNKSQAQPVLDWLRSELKISTDIRNDSLALQAILVLEPEDICRKQRGEDCCPVGKKSIKNKRE